MPRTSRMVKSTKSADSKSENKATSSLKRKSDAVSSSSSSPAGSSSQVERDVCATLEKDEVIINEASLVNKSGSERDDARLFQESNSEDDSTSRCPSQADTELIPTEIEDNDEVEPKDFRGPQPPFQTTHEGIEGDPSVIARDYAFHETPLERHTIIFPIVAVYIWFLYTKTKIGNLQRCQVAAIPRYNDVKKPTPDDYDLWTFGNLDLVYLIHFNWVTVEELGAWDEALENLGKGLRWLYRYGAGRRVDISPGATRCTRDTPLAYKCYSRFAMSKSIFSKARLMDESEWERAEARTRENHFNLGRSIFFEFTKEHERAVLPALYEFLCGRGEEPEMSQKMKDFFKPILHCHGGSVGGRGTPYERPRSADEAIPSIEEEVEQMISASNRPAPFEILFLEARLKEAKENLAQAIKEEEEADRELKEARAKKVPRKRRGHGWTKKKSQRSKAAVKAEPESESGPSQRLDDGKDERSNVPIKKEAGTRKPDRILTRSASTTLSKEKPSIDRKGKGKASELPSSEKAATGSKRQRDEDEDEDEDGNAADDETIPVAGSSRPRKKHRTQSHAEASKAKASVETGNARQAQRPTKNAPSRFSKRLRSVEPESLDDRAGGSDGQRSTNARVRRNGKSKVVDDTAVRLNSIDEEIEIDPVQETRANATASTSTLSRPTTLPPTIEKDHMDDTVEINEIEMSLAVDDDAEVEPETASETTSTPPLSPQAAIPPAAVPQAAIIPTRRRPLQRQETYMVDGPIPKECFTTKHIPR